MGGHYSGGDYNDVYSSSDVAIWMKVTSAAAWSPRQFFGVLAFNGKIWVMGGKDSAGNYHNNIYSSTDGVTWAQVTSSAAWSPRMSFGAVTAYGRIWVMGGTDDFNAYNDVWSSADGKIWRQEQSGAAWSARAYFGTVVANGKVWVMGGQDWSGNRMNDVWVYSAGEGEEVCPGTSVARPTAFFGEPTSEGHIDVTLRLPEGHQLSEFILPPGVVTSDADIRTVGVAGPNGDGSTGTPRTRSTLRVSIPCSCRPVGRIRRGHPRAGTPTTSEAASS